MRGMTFLRAFAPALSGDAEDLQMFPPGVHDIEPLGKDGKPVKLRVRIDADTAKAMDAARAKYQAAAASGVGDRPFFDFNHDDSAASAWPTEIYWAGEDPETGGVRAKVEWSSEGRAAVAGKVFRRFSPSFAVSKQKDPDGCYRIVDAPDNMGGLVNRAAFRSIQALFASTEPVIESTMNEAEIAALQAENKKLKDENAALKQQLDALKKGDAERVVEDAVSAGRIAPGPEVKAKWVGMILADASATELLASMPVNPALKGVTTGQSVETGKTEASVLEQFAAKQGVERGEFYRAHKDDLLRAHGAALPLPPTA